ncbi:MAG: carboxypeptidase-like regulatory domain-containing protein, partial [Ignavibacteria bacterium]|nr:carboxypeptidase-like regulatory domain-containing protein [Ignavibacteria bacterium]
MFRKFTAIIIFLLILPCYLYASDSYMASGKIAGKVIDSDTKEPLIGANIILLGTTSGSATNINGEYFILNVSSGTYSIKASYIGYNDYTIENIRVYGDLTTEVNFELSMKSFETKEVVVEAIRPLIEKNATNTGSLIKSEDIENLPVRGVNAVLSTQAGLVEQGGNFYVRGSRADAIAFYVDGVPVNNALFGGNQTSIINNAIEEIQFQAGGYPAEYGGATGGIVSTTLKTGGEALNASIEIITDNFVGANSDRKFLGGYSYGYSEYVATLSGPVIPNSKTLKFFLAVSNTFQRSPARFWDGANFVNLSDPSRGANADTVNLIYPAGYRINQAQDNFRIQGNITSDLNPLILKLSGTYYQYNNRDGVGI